MVDKLLLNIREGDILFQEVLLFIEDQYDFTPTAFTNGTLQNTAHENQGSCKVLAFAQLQELSQEDTLSLFAEHYEHVLADPDGTTHQNIRQFMQHGWGGISFEHFPLKAK